MNSKRREETRHSTVHSGALSSSGAPYVADYQLVHGRLFVGASNLILAGDGVYVGVMSLWAKRQKRSKSPSKTCASAGVAAAAETIQTATRPANPLRAQSD